VTRARKVGALALGALGLLMLAVTLTVPMFVMAGPAVLTVALFGAAWVVWP